MQQAHPHTAAARKRLQMPRFHHDTSHCALSRKNANSAAVAATQARIKAKTTVTAYSPRVSGNFPSYEAGKRGSRYKRRCTAAAGRTPSSA